MRRGLLRIKFGVRWTTYRRTTGMMKMLYHGSWHGVRRVGTRLTMSYKGRLRKVVARGGTVMARVGRKWRKIRKVVSRKKAISRVKRRVAMRIRIKKRWRYVYRSGSRFRIRFVLSYIFIFFLACN